MDGTPSLSSKEIVMGKWTTPIGQQRAERKADEATAGAWNGPVWEYKVISIKDGDEGIMNTMGAAGWELISAVPQQSHGISMGHMKAVFKRGVPSMAA